MYNGMSSLPLTTTGYGYLRYNLQGEDKILKLLTFVVMGPADQDLRTFKKSYFVPRP